MPSTTAFPPFPTNVPTHPLLIIDYELLQRRDSTEIERLWEAGTKLGFWYLKAHGVEEEVNLMFDLGTEVMSLPLEEKLKYEQGNDGTSAGYKAAGANAVDATGEKDTVEFLNISKDDILSYPIPVLRTYPPPVQDPKNMDKIVRPFSLKSLAITNTILDIFNDKLRLPEGTLAGLHASKEHSGCEARIIKNPPVKENGDAYKKAIGAHTDFGSLSFLHNRLGGLQVLVPGTDSWQYVKPIPDHAICNIGDALSIFSGGILRSNMHRVIPPPGAQSAYERYSIVFFKRPSNKQVLRALISTPLGSDLIARAVASYPVPEKRKFEPGVTAKEWFARRVKYQRIANRTGPETWMSSRGTEADPAVS